ncbi:TraB/GumN family protein [Luteimonas viscosa]|nr:TraB/GumN family protein [Luteimonas viscosa]
MTAMPVARLLPLLLLLGSAPVSAQEAATPVEPSTPVADLAGPAAIPSAPGDGRIVDHETVVVSGVLPGPGLWKVRKDGHVLYVMATVSPLPRRMQWESAGLESVVARSQQVLLPPSFTLDAGVGVFRGMLLLPSLLKARRNPDGATLQQMVSPELYARWVPLKRRYLGRNRGVEQWRPIFAAQELYEAAMDESGLSREDVVDKAVRRMARRHDVELRAVNYKLEIEDPKAVIREFQATTLADTECFEKTLSRIEGDLELMRRRANAWATGEIDTLRSLSIENQYSTCIRAMTENGLARRLGVSDLRPRLDAMWIAAAEETLAENASSFAMLPLSLVTAADGYLARLRERGYVVEPP